jgi:hypothetical protein
MIDAGANQYQNATTNNGWFVFFLGLGAKIPASTV